MVNSRYMKSIEMHQNTLLDIIIPWVICIISWNCQFMPPWYISIYHITKIEASCNNIILRWIDLSIHNTATDNRIKKYESVWYLPHLAPIARCQNREFSMIPLFVLIKHTCQSLECPSAWWTVPPFRYLDNRNDPEMLLMV